MSPDKKAEKREIPGGPSAEKWQCPFCGNVNGIPEREVCQGPGGSGCGAAREGHFAILSA